MLWQVRRGLISRNQALAPAPGGGGGGGSPLSFSTLFVGDPTTMANSGGIVTSWTSLDASGNAFTPTGSPTYSSDGAGFNGTSQYLQIPSFALGGTTVSAFISLAVASDCPAYAGYIGFAPSGTTDYTSSDSFSVSNNDTRGVLTTHVNATSMNEVLADSASTFTRIGMIFSGTAHSGYLNNVVGGGAFGPQSTSDTLATTGRLSLGVRMLPGTTTNFFKGTIKKFVITTVALNSTQRGELDTWLQA